MLPILHSHLLNLIIHFLSIGVKGKVVKAELFAFTLLTGLFLFYSTSLPSAAPFALVINSLSSHSSLSGETKKCLGASVLWGAGTAAAEGEDECRRAAGEDEEAPEGPRPPAQTHPESRRPTRLFNIAPFVLVLAPAFGRLGISMLLEQYHTSHSHAWRQPNGEWRSAVVTHAFTQSSQSFLCSWHYKVDSNNYIRAVW